MEIAETLQKKIKFGNALLDKNPVMLSGLAKLVAKSFVFMKCSCVHYILVNGPLPLLQHHHQNLL